MMNKKFLGGIFAGLMIFTSTSHAACVELAQAKTIAFEPANTYQLENIHKTIQLAIDFATKEEAKKIKLNVVDKNKADLCVCVDVTAFKAEEYWYGPSAYASEYTDSSKKSEWTDSANKKHTMYVKMIKSEIKKYSGGFTYGGGAKATVYIKDGRTGEVLLSYSDYNSNDKPIDAYRNILNKFYKKLGKEISESKKYYGA